MSQADGSAAPSPPGTALVRRAPAERAAYEGNIESVAFWVSRHRILLGGLLLIAAQLVWRAQFLSHQYFFYQDFFNLDRAIKSPFDWHYLTYIGTAHLEIGERAIVWVAARISLYDWGLATAITLALVGCADLAALRLLRNMFGDRPAVFALLAIYLVSPLAVASLGWWTVALESVPLQLATFLALDAHIRYVRTGRVRWLAATAVWVAAGMVSFEKGLVLPLLLFAVTSFLVGTGSTWLAGAGQALARYWRAWLLYGLQMAGYAIVLAVSLGSATAQPLGLGSAGAALTFGRGLIKDSFLAGAIGGPWRWLTVPGNWYALAAPPGALASLAVLVAAAVVAVSIWRRWASWRAWVILLGWIVLADMVPVIIARLGFSAVLVARDTRYVADAVPVMVICLGLAFLPLAEASGAVPVTLSRFGRKSRTEQWFRTVATALVAVFFAGSLWSAQAYQSVVSGSRSASYIAQASEAITLAPPGTPVLDQRATGYVALFSHVPESTVLGDISPGKLHWITGPRGVIDGMRIFGSDGRLYPAYVIGAPSLPVPGRHKCWPVSNGQITIRFWHASPRDTALLRIGYLLYSREPVTVAVQFGNTAQGLVLRPGLHAAYLPVRGSVPGVEISQVVRGLCVGDAEAGNPWPVTHSASVLP